MGDRNPITVLVNWPIHPRPLPHPPVHLPNWVRGRTIPIIPCHGLPAYVLMPRQFQVDVQPTRPCWHVVRKPMVDRLVERVLQHCPIHLPWPQRTRPLPLPRRLLPSQAKVPTIPTTPLLGPPENASTHCQYPRDDPPTRPCWPVARQPMVDKHRTFASVNSPIHPRRLPHLPPHQVLPSIIQTIHWHGRRGNVLPRYRFQVEGRPMPVRQHVVPRPMLDSRVELAWCKEEEEEGLSLENEY